MLPSETPTSVPVQSDQDVRAKLPSAEVLRELDAADVKTLKSALLEPLDYIANELLELPQIEQMLMTAAAASSVASRSAEDSGAYALLDPAGGETRLDREQMLFLELNYCRRRMVEVLQRYKGRRVAAVAVEELLHWARRVQDLRAQIVRENIPLVLAMAKRTRINGVDPSDLISEGNLALMRAVNKFDCARGYKFSTYACRAILKSFSRVASRTSRYRGHFPTEFDPTLEKSNHVQQRRVHVEDDCVNELRAILDENVGCLTDVERRVILARFALDGAESEIEMSRKGRTLEQVGEMIGVTKERVRQIQNKALDKLRTALDEIVLA